MGIFTLWRSDRRRIAATFKDWSRFRRQTGRWPWLSIAARLLWLVLLVLSGGFLIWWSVTHHWSKWQFLLGFLLFFVPFELLYERLEKAIRLREVRDRRKRMHVD